MNTKSITELLKGQASLRERLFTIMRQQKLAFGPFSKEVGVSQPTLIKFLKDEEDLESVGTLFKIEDWVIEQEKKLKARA